MTQEEFDQLPGLMSRKLFLRATGLCLHTLYDMIDSNEIKVRKIKGMRYAKYYKSEAARLAGFQLK